MLFQDAKELKFRPPYVGTWERSPTLNPCCIKAKKNPESNDILIHPRTNSLNTLKLISFVHHFWITIVTQGSKKYPFYNPWRLRFGNCEFLIKCAGFRGLDLILAFSKQATTAIILSLYLRLSGEHGLGLQILKSEPLLNYETKQRDVCLPRWQQHWSKFRQSENFDGNKELTW